MTGPFETEQQARETPGVRDVYAAFDLDPGAGKMAPHTHQMLMRACTAAGVSLGAYDRRILAWLATWEPQTAAVITGLISRAHDVGRAAAEARTTATIATLARVTAVLAGFDWENDDRQYALEAIDAIVSGGAS
jgi:hypothetical protein